MCRSEKCTTNGTERHAGRSLQGVCVKRKHLDKLGFVGGRVAERSGSSDNYACRWQAYIDLKCSPLRISLSIVKCQLSIRYRSTAREIWFYWRAISWPEGERVTISRGMFLPEASRAFFTAKGRPPQQGTCIRKTVTLRISLFSKMAESFWV